MRKKFWIPFTVNYAIIHTGFSFIQYDFKIAFILLLKTLAVSLPAAGIPFLIYKMRKGKNK